VQNRTFALLIGAYLTLLILVPGAVAGDVSVPASPLAQKLIDQANRVYLSPKGLSMHEAFNHDVPSAATYLGLALHGQKPYVKRNPAYSARFERFKAAGFSHLKKVIRAHGGLNPKDGTPIDMSVVKKHYFNSIEGGSNRWVKRHYGFDPATTEQPFILADAFETPGTAPPGGGFFGTPPENAGAISLLGETIGRPVKKKPPEPQPLRPSPPPATPPLVVSEKTTIPAGVLAGTWTGRRKDLAITFKPHGSGYEGTVIIDENGRDGVDRIIRTYEARETGSRAANPPYYGASRQYAVSCTVRCKPPRPDLAACEGSDQARTLDVEWDDQRGTYTFYGGYGLDIRDHFDKQ
jgi:hypothetical protein